MKAIEDALDTLSPVGQALSSLAVGADQVFAAAALHRGIPVTAVIPMADYERFFDGDELAAYRGLRALCAVTTLDCQQGDEDCFLAAGQWMARHADTVIAVWDGKEAEGRGGTADIVAYSLRNGRQVIHLDPFARTIRTLEPDGSSIRGEP